MDQPYPDQVYDAALTAWRAAGCHDEPAADCRTCDVYHAACEAFYAAMRARRDDLEPGEEWVNATGHEASCIVCGQAFNPCDDTDLIHLVTTVQAGVKWGDPSTYPEPIRRPLPAGLAADYTGDMPADGPERYCGGRGEHSGYWL